jgi:hypothetical protein
MACILPRFKREDRAALVTFKVIDFFLIEKSNIAAHRMPK